MTDSSSPAKERALEQFMQQERIARFDQVLSGRTRDLTIVLDGVHNHHNISAVIRSADAFGISTIHLVGEGFTYSKGITLGTERWLDIVHHDAPEEAKSRLRKEGYKIVVTAPEGSPKGAHVKSLPVYQLPFRERLALVFGNERTGVSDELFQAAEIHAYIPMIGFVESLNISVACAITLFCSMISGENRERELAPLAPDEREKLRSEWLVTGMKHAGRILREIERREDEKN